LRCNDAEERINAGINEKLKMNNEQF
jgi:hypothetical protein